jgi:cyclic 2,3-diphosphoglycerate synthetase
MARVLALVDGEHYPSTTRWALATARALGHEVVACLMVGGSEKVGPEGVDLGDVPVEELDGDLLAGVRKAIRRHRPDALLDLSDEPVLGYRERAVTASAALAEGVRYLGPDFALEPPIEGSPLAAPTLAVIGTGKRTGKTAVAGQAARALAANGFRPVLVAMGRGGPSGPQVVESGSMDLARLQELVEAGHHAASDYLEDAVTTGVTTVGARRAGGGLAGLPFVTNVREAAEEAVRLGAGLVILEGSGASIPPVPWDAGVLVCSARTPPEYLGGYLGPLRVLLTDLVVFTMGVGPDAGPKDLSVLTSHVQRLRPDARIVVTDFRPVPLGDVEGRKVYFTTTAPESVGPSLVSYLEETFRCHVVGTSHRLSDRPRLEADLEAAPEFEVLLTELKAAAVDVAARRAGQRGAEVVFVDNRAVTVNGDGSVEDLLVEAARLTVDRASER